MFIQTSLDIGESDGSLPSMRRGYKNASKGLDNILQQYMTQFSISTAIMEIQMAVWFFRDAARKQEAFLVLLSHV